MPLNSLWGYVVTDHIHETPYLFYFMWTVASFATAATTYFTGQQLFSDHRHLESILDSESGGHAVTPLHIQLTQTITVVPILVCVLALTSLFVPAFSYTMEMVIAIASCVVIGSLAQYFLQALGKPPMPSRLLLRLPEKKWWAGNLCGGPNDSFPLFGLIWSREPHKLTVAELRRAFHMVHFFVWTFMVTSAWQVGFSLIPTAVQKHADGWCHSDQILQHATNVALVILNVNSTLVGSAGLAIIGGAVSMALCDDGQDGNGSEITVEICRTPDSDLGAHIKCSGSNTLLIGAVTGGLLADWNQRNPIVQVKEGDQVVEVVGRNGDVIRGNSERMSQEIQQSQDLKLVIRRDLLKLMVLQKAATGQVYIQLPLLKVLLSSIPMGYKFPTLAVAVLNRTVVDPLNHRDWISVGTTLDCPVYDHQVMVPMLYCVMVTVCMAYVSFKNWRMYFPGDMAAESLRDAMKRKIEMDRRNSTDYTQQRDRLVSISSVDELGQRRSSSALGDHTEGNPLASDTPA